MYLTKNDRYGICQQDQDLKSLLVRMLSKDYYKRNNLAVFLAKDLKEKDLSNFEIKSQQPENLDINGLSSFLSETLKLNVKVVNKDIILFKAIDKDSNYSESGIINRKTGELVHEITKNIKSENSEKDITFYSCKKREKV